MKRILTALVMLTAGMAGAFSQKYNRVYKLNIEYLLDRQTIKQLTQKMPSWN